jgi:hypothetical protein
MTACMCCFARPAFLGWQQAERAEALAAQRDIRSTFCCSFIGFRRFRMKSCRFTSVMPAKCAFLAPNVLCTRKTRICSFPVWSLNFSGTSASPTQHT